jgi:hypothetical protein
MHVGKPKDPVMIEISDYQTITGWKADLHDTQNTYCQDEPKDAHDD